MRSSCLAALAVCLMLLAASPARGLKVDRLEISESSLGNDHLGLDPRDIAQPPAPHPHAQSESSAEPLFPTPGLLDAGPFTLGPSVLPSPRPSPMTGRRLQQAVVTAQSKAFASSIVADGASPSKTPAVAQTLLAFLDTEDESTSTESVAGAFVAAGQQDPEAASLTYAKTALLAAAGSQKQQRTFTASVAKAFTLAQSKGNLKSYVSTLAGAIQSSGDDRSAIVRSVGTAMAEASATADGGAAVAEAVAIAICEGDGTATAVSEALAIAVTINPNGCATVSVAFARATATCGPGFAQASSEAFATTFTTCNFNPFKRGNGNRVRRLDRVKVCRVLFGHSKQKFFKCVRGGFSSQELLQRLRNSRADVRPLLAADSGSSGNNGSNSFGGGGGSSNGGSNAGISAADLTPANFVMTDPAPGDSTDGSTSADVGTNTDPAPADGLP